MIRLQQLTGMRPNEVIAMRPCDIEQSGEVWLYRPASHKNLWRGHVRQIPLGPQSIAIIKSFLNRHNDAYLFSPAEAEAARQAERRRRRKSPMTPPQAARRPTKHAKRAKRQNYDVDSYRRAITYGIKKARRAGVEVPHWHPHQLRHTRATEIRRRYGLEGAQVVLGHQSAEISQIYAERDLGLAVRIAREIG